MGVAFQVFKYMPLSLVIEPTQLVVVPRTILLYEKGKKKKKKLSVELTL